MGSTSDSKYIKTFQRGDIIVEEGAEGEEMYIITSGSAGVYRNYMKPGELLIAELEQGNFFGEMSLFLNQARSATVVALSEVTAAAVIQKNALEIFSKQYDTFFSIMGELCRRIDTLNGKYQELYNRIGEAESVKTTAKRCSLFPSQHGEYSMSMLPPTSDLLYNQKRSCPICGREFESLTVISSLLVSAGVEKDLRARYLGIEPMHYEVVSCPQCLYSAPVYLFPTVSKRMSAAVMRELQPHRADVELKAGGERDTFTVFAGYYLAVKSAPLCFDEHQTVTAKLWKSLAAIYKDCGDDEMYLYASEKALADYMEAYSRLKLTEEQLQQICYAIGDLNERLGRLEEARQFFFMAKSARGGTNAMRIKADNRLEEVKELLKTR